MWIVIENFSKTQFLIVFQSIFLVFLQLNANKKYEHNIIHWTFEFYVNHNLLKKTITLKYVFAALKILASAACHFSVSMSLPIPLILLITLVCCSFEHGSEYRRRWNNNSNHLQVNPIYSSIGSLVCSSLTCNIIYTVSALDLPRTIIQRWSFQVRHLVMYWYKELNKESTVRLISLLPHCI